MAGVISFAGIQRRGALREFDDEDWRELMATNIDAVYYMGKAVARGMIDRGRGKIISLSDLHGAAIFLASPASDFVNGQTIYVDGGITTVI